MNAPVTTPWIVQFAPIIGGLATIVAALITVLGGSFAYRIQRNIDFRQELKKERRRVYADFMTSLIPATNGDGDPHLRARLEAAQLGSANVIRALSEYNKYADATGPGKAFRDPAKMRVLMSGVLLAMREDVFERDDLSVEQYASLLPIS